MRVRRILLLARAWLQRWLPDLEEDGTASSHRTQAQETVSGPAFGRGSLGRYWAERNNAGAE